MKNTTPNIAFPKQCKQEKRQLRRKTLEIKHDKSEPEKQNKLSECINKVAKFVYKIDRYYDQNNKVKRLRKKDRQQKYHP